MKGGTLRPGDPIPDRKLEGTEIEERVVPRELLGMKLKSRAEFAAEEEARRKAVARTTERLDPVPVSHDDPPQPESTPTPPIPMKRDGVRWGGVGLIMLAVIGVLVAVALYSPHRGQSDATRQSAKPTTSATTTTRMRPNTQKPKQSVEPKRAAVLSKQPAKPPTRPLHVVPKSSATRTVPEPSSPTVGAPPTAIDSAPATTSTLPYIPPND